MPDPCSVPLLAYLQWDSRSCILCRKRKIRCNRGLPCSNCLRSKSKSNTCVYENPPGQAGHTGPAPALRAALPVNDPFSSHRSTTTSQAPNPLLTNSVGVSTPNSSQLSSNPDPQLRELRLRIRQLEDQLSKKTPPEHHDSPASTTTSNIQKLSSGLGGTFHVHCESGSSRQPQTIARSVAHKTRLFGQSHWAVNGILLVCNDNFKNPSCDLALGKVDLMNLRFETYWN